MRRLVSLGLVAFVVALVPLAFVASWAKSEIVSTDAYVATVRPLASNRVVLADVHGKLSTAIVQGLQLPQLLDRVLPNDANRQQQVTDQVGLVVDQTLTTFLDSAAFRALWVSANRQAHTQVVALLHGDDTGLVQHGRVVLDLSPILQQVRAALAKVAVPGLAALPVPDIALQYQLFDVGSLGPVRAGVDDLEAGTPVLIVLLVAVALAAALVHPRRVQGAGHVLLGIGVGGGLLMAGIEGLLAVYRGKVGRPYRTVSEQVYDTLTHDLFWRGSVALVAGLGLGVVVLIARRLFDPTVDPA